MSLSLGFYATKKKHKITAVGAGKKKENLDADRMREKITRQITRTN